jgi:uncharacterized OB-fold protein
MVKERVKIWKNKTQERKADEIYCPSCGKPISKEAVVCPKCGVQIKELKNSTDTEAATVVQEKDPVQKAGSEATSWLVEFLERRNNYNSGRYVYCKL